MSPLLSHSKIVVKTSVTDRVARWIIVLLLLLLFLHAHGWAQQGPHPNTVTVYGVGAPSGSCWAYYFYLDTANSNTWACFAGAWVQVNGGGGGAWPGYPAAGLVASTGSAWTSPTATMVETALGFTPYNATNPSGYITSSALSPYLTSATAASTYAPIFTLTTLGSSGAATYTGNVLNIPQYSGGGMVYPGAGVPNSTGSAWGTSYAVGISASDIVQLNGSAQLPAVSMALLTGMTSSQVTTALTFTPVAPTVTTLSSLTTAAGGAFGTAAFTASSAYDAAGAASTAQTNAETFATNSGSSNTINATQVFGVTVPTLALGYLYYNGSAYVWQSPSGAGTVTSVGQTFTGGLISVAGSPITSSGTLALTVAGTSGGIPYFSSSSAWASSAALASGAIVTGGGAGTAPATDASATLLLGTLSLGASGTLGAVKMGNATSGTITLEPATGALGTITEYLPIASGDTLAGIAATQTLTNKSIALSEVNSGYTAGCILGASSTTAGACTAYTANAIPKMAPTATTPVASSITDNGTTIASAEPVVLGTANCTTFGTAGGLCATEGTSAINVSGTSNLYPDSTAHEWKAATNGSTIYGLMVRAQPGSIAPTALTASVSTATLCAAAAGACNVAGLYRVTFSMFQAGTACTANTTGGVSFQLTWADGNGTTHSAQTIPIIGNSLGTTATGFITNGLMLWGATTLGSYASGDITIATNGTVIQYATTYSNCSTGTATYELSAAVMRVQ
jgi:hypothetical protein